MATAVCVCPRQLYRAASKRWLATAPMNKVASCLGLVLPFLRLPRRGCPEQPVTLTPIPNEARHQICQPRTLLCIMTSSLANAVLHCCVNQEKDAGLLSGHVPPRCFLFFLLPTGCGSLPRCSPIPSQPSLTKTHAAHTLTRVREE